MAMVAVNGAELYYQVRGDGPPLLFIMGATGDGGHFEEVSHRLADQFTTVAYDRRGNGRSPCPTGWGTTSVEEQADDAAALMGALGLTPTAVFGTSSGGAIALCLLTRHPRVVRAAVLHEPALWPLFDDPTRVRNTAAAAVRGGMQAGGRPVALERFWRFVAGDANWETLKPALRERMGASAATYFAVESGAFDDFLPDDETLKAITAPVRVLVSDRSHDFFAQAAVGLAERLGTETTSTVGSHAPYLDHPDELAQAIRLFLG